MHIGLLLAGGPFFFFFSRSEGKRDLCYLVSAGGWEAELYVCVRGWAKKRKRVDRRVLVKLHLQKDC